MSPPAEPVRVTPRLLDDLPLPVQGEGASKHDRGTVLVVGGSRETAGGAMLAGLAALRVGAGRLRIVTVASASQPLVAMVPEARVIGVAETSDGAIDPSAAIRIAELASAADAVVVGAAVLDPVATTPLVDAVTASGTAGVVVFDAGALLAAGRHPEWVQRLEGRAVLTPNPTEMARLELEGRDDWERCRRLADATGAVVALRGADTFVVTPDGRRFVDSTGTVGLATSGSGDAAAGVFGGLAAQWRSPVTAAVWAPYLHGRAGERLAARVAPVGFLARELLDELPAVLDELRSGTVAR